MSWIHRTRDKKWHLETLHPNGSTTVNFPHPICEFCISFLKANAFYCTPEIILSQAETACFMLEIYWSNPFMETQLNDHYWVISFTFGNVKWWSSMESQCTHTGNMSMINMYVYISKHQHSVYNPLLYPCPVALYWEYTN